MQSEDLIEQLFHALLDKGYKLALAESCTGGLLAATITHKPGASQIFERGFVTYSNQSKINLLGVSKDLIESQGAVSAVVATSMAMGAVKHSNADFALAVTGVAGPDGGTEDKPVGTVFIGYAIRDDVNGSFECHFEGDRSAIRAQTCTEAIKQAVQILKKED